MGALEGHLALTDPLIKIRGNHVPTGTSNDGSQLLALLPISHASPSYLWPLHEVPAKESGLVALTY